MDRHPNLRVDHNKKHGKDGRRQPSAPVSLRIERTVSSHCVSLSCNTIGLSPARNAVYPSVRVPSSQKASRIWPSYSWRDGNNCLSAATYSRLSLVNLTVSAVMVTWNRSRNR